MPALATHLQAAWLGAESHCIKCGFCLPVCPTYRETGNEAASPRGRLDLMDAAARGLLPVTDIRASLALCLGCLACETACPSGIRFGEMLEAGRADGMLAQNPHGSAAARAILALMTEHPRLLRLLAWSLWLYQRSGLQRLLRATRLLDAIFPGLARLERSAPTLPRPTRWRRAARGHLAKARERGEAPAGHAALFTGCVMDVLFAPTHAATVKVLARNGWEVQWPRGQGCCGALHAHAGFREAARALARRNIAAFQDDDRAPVVVNSAGCGAALKTYGHLLADDPDWSGRAGRFSARVRDISEFLAGLRLVAPERPLSLRVAYDEPCHLLHAQKISAKPRTILSQVPGLEIVPLAEAEWCCGSAGLFSFTQGEMSERVLARKMAHVERSGAQAIATGNPGCLLQIQRGAAQRGLELEVLHPVELLARAYA